MFADRRRQRFRRARASGGSRPAGRPLATHRGPYRRWDGRVEQRHRRFEKRPPCVHEKDLKTLVPQEHLLQEQWVVQRHPGLGKLISRLISGVGRPGSHMNGDRDIEFLRESPIRLETRIGRGNPEQLQAISPRALIRPVRSSSRSHAVSGKSRVPSQWPVSSGTDPAVHRGSIPVRAASRDIWLTGLAPDFPTWAKAFPQTLVVTTARLSNERKRDRLHSYAR